MTKPVEGYDMNGIPVVELTDHRGFATADELSAAILSRINSGALPPAPKEMTARVTGAAVAHRLFMRKFGKKMLVLRDRFQPTSSADVRTVIDAAADKLRGRTAHIGKPDTFTATGNGVGAAVQGQATILGGAGGDGDGWLAGEGFEKLEQGVHRAFPDTGHPVRRLWRGLVEKLDS